MKNINKYRHLDNIQKEIRLEIMNVIIDKQTVVNLDDIMKHISSNMGMSKEYLRLTLEKFIKENIMVVDNNENVNFIYPVSAHPTMHKVKLNDGRKLNAMCAIDALGMSVTFNQDIKINSMCCVTGKEIEIDIKDNNIDYINNSNLCVLHINLEKYENWAASC